MNIKYKKIFRIAEINLNSNSTYKRQVLIMCSPSNLNECVNKINLIISKKINCKSLQNNLKT